MPNLEALYQLRRVVSDAPEELLHMRAIVETASCGTARCAIGWCLVDKWFQTETGLPQIMPPEYNSVFPPANSFGALAMVFGLSQENTEALFAGEVSISADPHSVSKEKVLWNIDELLAGREALPYEATESEAPMFAGGLVNQQYEEEPMEWEEEEED